MKTENGHTEVLRPFYCSKVGSWYVAMLVLNTEAIKPS